MRAVLRRLPRLSSVVNRQSSLLIRSLASIVLAVAPAAASAQARAPQRTVEIVVISAPAGSNDRTARQLEKVITENRFVSGPLAVVNKPGCGGNLAFAIRIDPTGVP